jgi:hypothetical protein
MDQEKIFMIGSPILFLKNRTTCILCLGAERDALFHPKKKEITLTRTIVAVEKKQEAISVD